MYMKKNLVCECCEVLRIHFDSFFFFTFMAGSSMNYHLQWKMKHSIKWLIILVNPQLPPWTSEKLTISKKMNLLKNYHNGFKICIRTYLFYALVTTGSTKRYFCQIKILSLVNSFDNSAVFVTILHVWFKFILISKLLRMKQMLYQFTQQ